jgi:hypothetical protein
MSQMEKSLSTEPIVFETNSFISFDGGGYSVYLESTRLQRPSMRNC